MPLKQNCIKKQKKKVHIFDILSCQVLAIITSSSEATHSSTRLITWHVMRVTYACRSSSKSLGDLIWNHVHSASSDAHAVNSIYSICDARVSHWAIISIGTLIVKLPSHSIETKMYIRVCWERERERESQEKKIRAGYYIAEWATSSPVELLCWAVRVYIEAAPREKTAKRVDSSRRHYLVVNIFVRCAATAVQLLLFNKIIVIIKKRPQAISKQQDREKGKENKRNKPSYIYVMVYTDDIIQGRARAKSETSRSFFLYVYIFRCILYSIYIFLLLSSIWYRGWRDWLGAHKCTVYSCILLIYRISVCAVLCETNGLTDWHIYKKDIRRKSNSFAVFLLLLFSSSQSAYFYSFFFDLFILVGISTGGWSWWLDA